MTNGYQPLSWAEILAYEIPELEWTVEGILPRASATLLTAREKSGKGLLALDLCVSVALGEPFLDRAVTQGPTIYLAGEENLREVRYRLSERINGLSDVEVYVLLLNGQTEDSLRFEDPESLMRFEAMVKEIEPAVVVFDAMREFHNGQEDSSDEMAPMLRPWRQVSHANNVAMIVNHHMNKSGSSRGSTAILASFDQGWAFRRSDTDPNDMVGGDSTPRGVLVVEGRFGPRVVESIELGDHLRWIKQAAPSLATDATVPEAVRHHLIQRSAWMTARQIADGLHINLKSVQNAISAMQREHQPPIIARGTGKKGSPREYMTTTPDLFPDSGNDGNDLGTKNDSQNNSHLQGYGVGNNFSGNNPCIEEGCTEQVAPGSKYYCVRHGGRLEAA